MFELWEFEEDVGYFCGQYETHDEAMQAAQEIISQVCELHAEELLDYLRKYGRVHYSYAVYDWNWGADDNVKIRKICSLCANGDDILELTSDGYAVYHLYLVIRKEGRLYGTDNETA